MVTRRRTTRARRGLTLLELMIAITVAAMVAVMLATAVQMVSRRFGNETMSAFEDRKFDRVRALLSSQLAWIELTEDRSPRRFVLTQDSLEFRTLVSATRPDLREPTLVRYTIERTSGNPPVSRLLYAEHRLGTEELDAEDVLDGELSSETAVLRAAAELQEAQALAAQAPVFTLIDNRRTIRMEALVRGVRGQEWLPRWSERSALPRAIRVSAEPLPEFDRRTIRTDDQNALKEDVRWVLPVVVTF